MLKIFSVRHAVREISKTRVRNIRKYGGDCPKPEYECPHKKKPTATEIREQHMKSIVHPFLKKDDSKHSSKFWRLVFFAVNVPSMLAAYVIAFHVVPSAKRPPFLEYNHLRIRTKAFPWGDGVKSFFHNPHTNALPTGYETEEEDED